MSAVSLTLCRQREISDTVVAVASEGVLEELGIPSQPGPPVTLPRSAFHQHRGQYLADEVLASLPRPHEGSLCLGIVAVDLFTHGLNFVFGLASGRRALVSIARLRGREERAEHRALFLRRVRVEVVHEAGHTLGYAHCSNPTCVMHFSNTLADTDRKGPRLCERCRAQLPLLIAALRERRDEW